MTNHDVIAVFENNFTIPNVLKRQLESFLEVFGQTILSTIATKKVWMTHAIGHSYDFVNSLPFISISFDVKERWYKRSPSCCHEVHIFCDLRIFLAPILL